MKKDRRRNGPGAIKRLAWVDLASRLGRQQSIVGAMPIRNVLKMNMDSKAPLWMHNKNGALAPHRNSNQIEK